MDEAPSFFTEDLISRLVCLRGRDAALELDPGLTAAAVAASVLVFWFLSVDAARRMKRVESSRAFAPMMILGLCALLPITLLLEGVSDGSIWFPARRKRIEFLASCDPKAFWSVAALYWCMSMAAAAYVVAAWSRWREPSRSGT